MAWVPLESNPEVMTKFLHKLGVPKKWILTDVLGLEPELLAMLPKPTIALILLYPISSKLEGFKTELETRAKDGPPCDNKIYHMIQYVSNACGTVALIHSVANNLDKIDLEEGDLKKFLDDSKDMTSEERGHLLVGSSCISNAHEDFAHEGQTEAPGEDEKVIHHFLAFVESNGSIYELDGRKPYPINHGKASPETFLEDAAKICKKYMSRDPDEVRFTMMALTGEE